MFELKHCRHSQLLHAAWHCTLNFFIPYDIALSIFHITVKAPASISFHPCFSVWFSRARRPTLQSCCLLSLLWRSSPRPVSSNTITLAQHRVLRYFTLIGLSFLCWFHTVSCTTSSQRLTWESTPLLFPHYFHFTILPLRWLARLCVWKYRVGEMVGNSEF